MSVASTFSGIGGLEHVEHDRGRSPLLLCEWWEPARAVLDDRFSGVPLHGDVADLAEAGLPAATRVLTAGFPCTDLSQAGRTAGINGEQSGQVRHVFAMLARHPNVHTLVLENVRNMLVLDRGGAMAYLVDELESLGFRWAYRLVDTRSTGLPQRRHRVILVATRGDGPDPGEVLFADDAPEPDHEEGPHLAPEAFGFYWTEGLRGLGWVVDGVPPLKGGSSLGIPSPPGVWIPGAPLGRRIVTPSIEHAERLQGFPTGWTKAADQVGRKSHRWKLVGNAVSVPVGGWVMGRVLDPGPVVVEKGRSIAGGWPAAASGGAGQRVAMNATTWPHAVPYIHLLDILDPDDCEPLTARAAAGFLKRLRRSSLSRPAQFEADLADHIEAATTAASGARLPL